VSVLESPDHDPTPRSARSSDGGALDTAPDRRIGQLVDGKYFILRRLACGGMGSVYEARHNVVGRHFALKFLHDHYAQRSSMVQRFLREAQAAGSLASEHIIGVLDYGSADGVPYLVMELVRGQDLRELLSQTPRLEERRAVRIVLDACRGLELAHEHGLVHRDLKPANICVTVRSDGREVAKVIDFGVAKLRDGVDLSEEGTLIGTVGYMAPEQLTDHRQLDGRADIYALGVILYQALSGRPPHHCQRSELLYRIVSIDPPTLSEIASGLSPGLSEVVQRALARNRDRRYPNIREFARALEPYAGEPPQPREASQPRARQQLKATAGDLGTAVTELESAPTWVALRDSARGQIKGERLCERHCERQSSAGSDGIEEFCQQLPGISPLPPPPARDHRLSQRALVLSVGALVLSVVAMTTMFAFVYSQGSQALEMGARPREAVAAARALPERAGPDPLAPDPTTTPSYAPALAASNVESAGVFGPGIPPGWTTASSSDPPRCEPGAGAWSRACASEPESGVQPSVSVQALRGAPAASSAVSSESSEPSPSGD
jgi:serine/threonine protein kinase